MSCAIITGSSGLIGSEAVRFFSTKGFHIIGIDNDMRAYFFGDTASTKWRLKQVQEEFPNFTHYDTDIRDSESMENVFQEYGPDIKLIIHTAAQPSHEWAAHEPVTDFTINANGTLNLLEKTRTYCPDAVFIFTSTNKVYGDGSNQFPLVEKDMRWEIGEDHPYFEHGIDEELTIDASLHTLFGASKVAADILVQEYGRYFQLKTGIFRCGCLSGSAHSAVELHGFLTYLMQCVMTGKPYKILGYKGKQVRDSIHSQDLVNMFWHFYQKPHSGEVYNAGGSRHSHCSILEAIQQCNEIAGKKLNSEYVDQNRTGDHLWWVSSVQKFKHHYPNWNYTYDLGKILEEIYHGLKDRI